ncbi:23S rRNA (pseudouridine1915-N3)-methyltransferase [Candidatus Electrothrix aarhusensis]|uniref:Ribosomal RNA large subunit methyltransferase H n=1 Tax=Candidatus Electrothrix aarhusensis TaxID=1859131 RepID=A0A444IUC9_9BACT|nr:23S rRNA (pseudouridine1915-N3)-methyltransferase [Candidatus Electrothrix aarhusensis]
MKITLPFLGKTKEKYLDQAIQDYAGRLRRYLPLEIKVLKSRHAKNDAEQVIMAREAEQLLSHASSASLTVALDPTGREQTSEEIAAALQAWEDRGIQTLCFLIGGHLGLDQQVRRQADQIWSLSRLTFTHEMTRFILLEQLYRACSIKSGHNYHK